MTDTTIVTTAKGTYEPVDNNPHAVAGTLNLMEGCLWLPPIKHWEIATTDDLWGLHGELDKETYGPASRALQETADYFGVTMENDEHRKITVDFIYSGTPIRLWWLNLVTQWVVPETCAVCPTELGAPDVTFVRLGETREGAVYLCVPCRDRMHTEFVATNATKGTTTA